MKDGRLGAHPSPWPSGISVVVCHGVVSTDLLQEAIFPPNSVLRQIALGSSYGYVTAARSGRHL